VVTYRHFRNTDPPALVKVWNEALTGRGAIRLRHSSALEHQVFSRPYFDPSGLIVAEEDGEIVGFAHAGFGPGADQSALSSDIGVICVLAVRPTHRRHGIGAELLRQSEAYLRDHGAKEIYAGPASPYDPFYQLLYGGSNLPGFLASDELAGPFLEQHGYALYRRTLVLQRQLQKPLRVADPRFMNHRQRFDIYADTVKARPTWWQNCELGVAEPLEFVMQEKPSGQAVATALVVELEGFSWRWNQPAVGILDIQVRLDRRRQAIGKYFLTQILQFLQEQCYLIVETQVPEGSEPALKLVQGLGFEQVDTGKMYQKK
jgi:ribosomal protein S18 acetylase RimI-like enzyme